MVNILLLGTVRPFGNKGDEAIYITTVNLIKKYLPNSKVVLASFEPRKALKQYHVDAAIWHPMGYPFGLIAERIPSGSILKRIIKFVSYRTPPYVSALSLKLFSSQYREIYSDADLYVVLSFPFEKEGFPVYVTSCSIERYHDPRKPILIFPISISTSVLYGRRKNIVKRSLSKANIVFTRGEYTTKILRKSLNLKNVLTAFDPAVLLPKVDPVFKPSGGVAITPAGLIKHPKVLAKLVDALIEKLGIDCWIVPTSIGDVKESFLGLIKNAHMCSIINTEKMSPFEVKGFLSHVDVLITARVHAAIFALSENVPAVAILREDDMKFYDVLGAFGLDHLIYNINYFDLENILNKIVQSVSIILNRKKQFVNIIRERKQDVIKKAEIPGLLLRRVLTC
ncbi:MAG: polysaccharide pyruvyl transferase family protein [Desulfurococcaceae archaeon]